MIAVVTGSSGFIGGHLADALLARGATVRCLRRPSSRDTAYAPDIEQRHTGHLSTHTVNLLDARAVAESDVWRGATHVFHVAGLTAAPSHTDFRRGNVTPLANMLPALAARREKPRVVVVSSQAASGPARDRATPVCESDPPLPVDAYGTSKREAECVAESFMPTLPICVVRPPAVYGPRDVDFLAAFRQAVARVAFFATAPDNVIDLLHVADVVSALLLAGEGAAAPGNSYLLSADTGLTWRELYRAVSSLAGTNPREVAVPEALLRVAARVGDLAGTVTGRTPLLNSQKLALGRPRYWLADSTRIRQELGWRPAFTPRDGLRDTYLWYVARGWLPAPKSSRATP